MANFDTSFARTLKEEGGYVNDPNDKGGETKYGIAKRYHPNVDVKNLTIDGAKAIYQKEYWNAINGNAIKDQGIADSVYDFGVIAGPGKSLSLATNAAKISGVPDWKTATGKRAQDFNRVFGRLRVAYHEARVRQDPTQLKFLKGWKSRAERFFVGNLTGALVLVASIGLGGYWLLTRK